MSTPFVTILLSLTAVGLAIVALGLRTFAGKDTRGPSMHTHEVLARRRQLLAQLKEKKEK